MTNELFTPFQLVPFFWLLACKEEYILDSLQCFKPMDSVLSKDFCF